MGDENFTSGQDNTVTDETNSETNEQSSDVNASAESSTQQSKTSLGDSDSDAKNNDEDNSSNNDADEFAKEYIGKPETGYDYNEIELPEGMTIDEDGAKQLNDIATKYNMSNKGACELMKMAVANATKIQQQILQSQTNETNQRLERYQNEILNDSEIGGDKFDECKALAEKAYKQFIQIDKEAHELFVKSTLNSNPAVFKMFVSIGKQMGDGKIHSGSSSASSKKDVATRLFGSENK